VVNYADREQYLQCLAESNKGDLSPLIDYMMLCIEQQLQELVTPVEPSQILKTPISPEPNHVESDPIVAVLQEIGAIEPEDPLAAVMKTKVTERQRIIETEYEAWRSSILTIPSEFKAIVDEFNSNDAYLRAGYSMCCQTYDVLTLEKYIDVAIGRNVPRTWFVGVELCGPLATEKTMLFFDAASPIMRRDGKASGVSVRVGRFDGTGYVPLDAEPITLREVGYRQGTILFLSRMQMIEEGAARMMLKAFLADVIKSYL
jgi:hypothetical protein